MCSCKREKERKKERKKKEKRILLYYLCAFVHACLSRRQGLCFSASHILLKSLPLQDLSFEHAFLFNILQSKPTEMLNFRATLLLLLQTNVFFAGLALISPHFRLAYQEGIRVYAWSLPSSYVLVDSYIQWLFQSTAAVIPSIFLDAGILQNDTISTFNRLTGTGLIWINQTQVPLHQRDTASAPSSSVFSSLFWSPLPSPVPSSPPYSSPTEMSNAINGANTSNATTTSTPQDFPSHAEYMSLFSLPWQQWIPMIAPCQNDSMMLIKWFVYFLFPFTSVGLFLKIIPLSQQNIPAVMFDLAVLSPFLCCLQYLGMTRGHGLIIYVHSIFRTILFMVSAWWSGFADERPELYVIFIILLFSRLRLQPLFILRLFLVSLLEVLMRTNDLVHHHRPARVVVQQHGQELQLLPPRLAALLLQRVLDAIMAWEGAGLHFTSTDASLLYSVSGRIHDMCENVLQPFVAPSSNYIGDTTSDSTLASQVFGGDDSGRNNEGSCVGEGNTNDSSGTDSPFSTRSSDSCASASANPTSLPCPVINSRLRVETSAYTLPAPSSLMSSPSSHQGDIRASASQDCWSPSSFALGHDRTEICVVCMDAPSSVICYPCGHAVMCRRCFEILENQATTDSSGARQLQCSLCRMYVRKTRSVGLLSMAEYQALGVASSAEAVAKLVLYVFTHREILGRLSPKALAEFARLGVQDDSRAKC